MTTWKALISFACSLAVVPIAGAQVVVGVDNPDMPVYSVDVNTGLAAELFTPSDFGADGIWGMAADNANGCLYYSGGSSLYRVPYETLEPEYIGTFNTGADASITIVGLGFDPETGLLYGTRSSGDEGVYQINPSNGHASLLYSLDDSSFDLGGFDYDASTDAFYGLNDDITPLGRGLFEIDPFDQTFELVANYPVGQTDIDGLAVGDGRAYLVTDDPGEIFIYNLITNEYEGSIDNPWFSSELFSGATWAPNLIPTPSAMTLLAIAGLIALRRKQR